MAVAIKLPDMGTNVEECKVLVWRKKPGEVVKRGDVLADIETDKTVAELESTGEGVLLDVIVKPGGLARTGDILAYVGKPGESVGGAAESLPPETVRPLRGPHADDGRASGERESAPPTRVETGRSPYIAPVVRNLAAKLGVDLGRVTGTGVGGIITREDVQRASREQAK